MRIRRKRRGDALRLPRSYQDNHALSEPVRRVITRRATKVTGLFASRKSAVGLIPWESQLERDFLRIVEVDRDVVRVDAQPVRLKIVLEGHVRTHIPDYKVYGRNGQWWLVEVKSDEDAADPQVESMLAAAAKVCLERNISYVVAKESDIRRQPRLKNVDLLLRYNRSEPSINVRIQLDNALAKGPMEFGALRRAIPGYDAMPEICFLIATGVLVIDMEVPLSSASFVWLETRG